MLEVKAINYNKGLEVKNINYTIDGNEILTDVSAAFQPGKLSMIIGPNGSGKSTLLKIISHEIDKYSGSVFYDGKLISKKERVALAKLRAVLSQQSELSFPLSVEEVVMMGRYPHFSFKPGKHDIDICTQALRKMQMEEFVQRNYLTLSGGEKQRVHFARTLAQIWEQQAGRHRYLFLDEPITSLDLNYQHEFLRVAKEIARQDSIVIAVIHDINLAAQYADYVIMLNKGSILATGTPKQVITEDNLFKLYGLKCRVIEDSLTLFPHFVVDDLSI